ncbi:unnamed protein product [Symbiodinium sp. CCMP2592]|nr:unnamed protein product [Symbiodinium sp. CCMP2592]
MESPGERKLASCIAYAMRLADRLKESEVKRHLGETLAMFVNGAEVQIKSRQCFQRSLDAACQTPHEIITRPQYEALMEQLATKCQNILLEKAQAIEMLIAENEELKGQLEARTASSMTASMHPLAPDDSDDMSVTRLDEREYGFAEGGDKTLHEPGRLQESASAFSSSCAPQHAAFTETLKQLKDQCCRDKLTARQHRRRERMVQAQSQPQGGL